MKEGGKESTKASGKEEKEQKKGKERMRLLSEYAFLRRGGLFKISEWAEKYGVTEKTIRRDIQDINEHLADERNGGDGSAGCE